MSERPSPNDQKQQEDFSIETILDKSHKQKTLLTEEQPLSLPDGGLGADHKNELAPILGRIAK